MTLTALPSPSHTIEDRLVAASELVSRFNVTADHVTIDSSGITIAGDLIDWIPDLIPALALELVSAGGPGEADVYRGSTFDGIPVAVEHHRG